MLLKASIEIGDDDAETARNHPVDYLFCEVESPELHRRNNGDEQSLHLKFWKNNGFFKLGFDYIQPALSDAQKPVEGLWFMAYDRYPSTRHFRRPLLEDDEMAPRLVKMVLYDYFRFSMGIEDPATHPVFTTMSRQLDTALTNNKTKGEHHDKERR